MSVACLALAATLVAARGAATADDVSPSSATTFDSSPWLADYEALRTALERSYANLAWFASRQSPVDIPSLHRRTLAALASATSDRSARAVLISFVREFGDGHLSIGPPAAPAPPVAASEIPPPAFALDAPEACAALGYVRTRGTAFSSEYEALPSFALIADGVQQAYRTGIVTASNGVKLGIVRLPNFSPEENPPECEHAWNELRAGALPSKLCDDSCTSAIEDAVNRQLLEHLRDRLVALRTAGAQAVVVDLGRVPGGSDIADWIPRLFTADPVSSARLGLVRVPASSNYYDEQLDDLRDARKRPLSSSDRRAVDAAIKTYESRKAEVKSGAACAMDWVWTQRREWSPLASGRGCTNLVFGGTFASGAKPWLARNSIASRDAARAIYWPSLAWPVEGSWTGPVYVAIDGNTYSAGEMAAAVFADNHIATLIGDRTGGDGCGFMYGSNFTLPKSRLTVRIPNCVRLRRDGTDEVAGIAPDIALPSYRGEGSAQHARRLIELVAADSARRRLGVP